ncbi:MAG: GNAT family N-acetyltransferase [bacterium]|nr:GNAT family N-acetyltransferase [bacterium]
MQRLMVLARWNLHSSIQETKSILLSFIEAKNEFALELKENHKVIGSLGLEELSINLGRNYDNYIGQVIRYCFDIERYDFLLCSHSVTNRQSKRVIEKCGF